MVVLSVVEQWLNGSFSSSQIIGAVVAAVIGLLLLVLTLVSEWSLHSK